MLITKELEIDTAHRLPAHASKCRNLHGHRYKIEVGVNDAVIQDGASPQDGMVIDFADIKKIMLEKIDVVYDHNAIFQSTDPILGELLSLLKDNQEKSPVIVDFAPTVENISRHFFRLIDEPLKAKNITLEHVKVWETPTCTAVCTRKDI